MKLTIILEVDEGVTLSATRTEILWNYKGAKIIREESSSAADEIIERAAELGFIDG